MTARGFTGLPFLFKNRRLLLISPVLMFGILSFIGFSTSYKRKMVNNVVYTEAILIRKNFERFLSMVQGPSC